MSITIISLGYCCENGMKIHLEKGITTYKEHSKNVHEVSYKHFIDRYYQTISVSTYDASLWFHNLWELKEELLGQDLIMLVEWEVPNSNEKRLDTYIQSWRG